MIRMSTIMASSVLMIRNVSAHDHLILNGPYIQCVRWKRKPMWLPIAKTKLFRIPVKPVIPTEEVEELKHVNYHYKTYMRSLRHYFITREEANKVEFDPVSVKKMADEEFLKCSKINEEWNAQISVEREQRLAQSREARVKEIIEKLAAKKERDLITQATVDAEIKKAKEEVKTFITLDNIDEAIENALKTVIDHNAAINLDGSFYTGNHEKTRENVDSTM
ncbi:probable 28S ribosomal protein S26, mitochondrial [Hylaeus volcanicus]|uniref:probable 28S ribosomal protein S26, mitochondrial n=1 Tax=Hylaeus volcanicus TaxID=313075 RepID=UPI0023B79C10|nr:probable 28S ribosomal protein S26, mitochondrial [Hylaeus volcanicus]